MRQPCVTGKQQPCGSSEHIEDPVHRIGTLLSLCTALRLQIRMRGGRGRGGARQPAVREQAVEGEQREAGERESRGRAEGGGRE
eukprot:6139284-Prymnesium_polylepis.1